ncbi:hypothetical protein FHS18_001120 [Paenibacillus phyllosphaerae]|uniref:Purine nucleoside phosphorylase n=1 Tax=Paenibacillus phyllosphaerae TaxID=274593 RepID=A0A7W5AUL5_9BACL|nr:peptidoglycan editing factor PgeF [Paenibacillus phyllosphaerae]MBB3109068.1 hypothetical protein [Paenibacillus phyllosphaerae]
MREPFEQSAAKEPSLFLISSWMKDIEGLTAGFTGREGGVSAAPWTGLNCGLHVGDANEDVIRNRQLLVQALGWSFEAWTCAEQVHGNRVVQVTHADRGKGNDSRQNAVAEADALMTNEEDVLLTSFYADCVPLYFVDPVKKAVALAHAGWKGTVQEIARMTVEAMAVAYGSDPADIHGAIGPSIGGCCYEVDETVLKRVEPLLEALNVEAAAQAEIIVPTTGGKATINLKEINRQIMIKAGILPTNIEITSWCTGCRTDLFFSHRMEQGKTGRMVSWIGIGRGAAQA